jgi:hypothetical protein
VDSLGACSLNVCTCRRAQRRVVVASFIGVMSLHDLCTAIPGLGPNLFSRLTFDLPCRLKSVAMIDMKRVFTSKAAVNVVLMLSLKFFGIDPPDGPIRVLFGTCIVLHLVCLLLVLLQVRSGVDGPKFTAKEVDRETQKCVHGRLPLSL